MNVGDGVFDERKVKVGTFVLMADLEIWVVCSMIFLAQQKCDSERKTADL